MIGFRASGDWMSPASNADSRESELLDRLVEVALGRGLHAVRAVPEVHEVHVVLEDLVLGQLVLEPDREDRLARLGLQVALAVRGSVFFTSCCVIVEPPCEMPPASTFLNSARTVPARSTPLCS